MSQFEKARRCLMSAQTANTMLSAALADYQTACGLGDQTRADEAAFMAKGALESFLDHYGAAQRVMLDG